MSDIKRINAEQFRIYPKDSRYCIIDVRDHHEYATGSEATVCWPANEINSVTAYEFVNAQKLTPDQTVILLCARGMGASAAAEKLQTLIPNHISVVEGGHAALAIACSTKQKISIERQVRIAAGILVLISIIGSMLIHPALIIFSVFMACGLIFSGITDWCGLGLLMMKMTWNQPRK